MKEGKNAKNEPSLTSLMCQMVLVISHFGVRNLGKMDVTICKISTSFSHKCVVKGVIWQHNKNESAVSQESFVQII